MAFFVSYVLYVRCARYVLGSRSSHECQQSRLLTEEVTIPDTLENCEMSRCLDERIALFFVCQDP